MRTPSEILLDQKGRIGSRVGLLGGTFDPVHNGHLAIAAAVREGLGLDAVLFIPAAHPPHKPDYEISSFEDRVAMLELAIAHHPEFLVTSLEAERPGPSYSVDTLRCLRELWGREVRLFFIIGLDAFVDIGTWKEYGELPRLADLVVLNRPSFDMAQTGRTIARFFPELEYDAEEAAWVRRDDSARILAFAIEPVAVSSTRVRQQIEQHQPLAGLVPPAVARYIRGHHLYAR